MSAAARNPGRPQRSWPTGEQLESAGFVRCVADGCTTFLDPTNVRGRYCSQHRRLERERRRTDGFQNRPRITQATA